MTNTNKTKPENVVATATTPLIPFSPDKHGFLRQNNNPCPFVYDTSYKARQGTNTAMSWLRIGWLAAHIPYPELKTFNAVDIGSGNGSFVKEAQNVFKRIFSYDLAGESIADTELYSTNWDLISMADVLEHYPDIDDLWTLSFEYALISFPEKPMGTDLRQWRHYKPNEHLYMLDAATFSQWVVANNYKVIAQGCPEDFIRKRWDTEKTNISTFLIKRNSEDPYGC